MKRPLLSLVVLALMVAFPVAFMWQGLDVTDTGYTLTNCQQFFHAYPHDLTDPGIGCVWLSYFLGALWYQLTGCGLIGFRVFYILITLAILGLVWLPFRRFESDRTLVALFAGSALVIAKSLYLPSYNEFTALLFAATAVALYRGLTNRQKLWILVAGFTAGASVFVRLPNLAIGGIVIAAFFYRAIEASDRTQFFTLSIRRAINECVVFFAGCVAGAVAVMILMAALGHLPAYFTTLRQMSAMFGDPTQHHGAWPLLKGLLHDYFYVAAAGVVCLVGGLIVSRLAGVSGRPLFRATLIALSVLVVIPFLLGVDDAELYFWPGMLYLILLTGALGLLNLSNEYRLLCVLAAIVLFLTPLGSNNGIFNAVYAMHFAVPVAILALIARPAVAEAASSRSDSKGAGRGIYRRAQLAASSLDTAVLGYAAIGILLVFSALHRWQFTYRDSAERLAMRSTVDHPRLRHLFTTASRAKSIEELLQHLQPLVNNGDYLMDHTQIPMIYFLTGAKPYLYSSWANLYAPPAFERQLEEAEATRARLPVCVRTKVDTCHPGWPDQTYPPSSSYRFEGNRRLVDSFLAKNKYRKYWEDNAFEIWLPLSYHVNGRTNSQSNS